MKDISKKANTMYLLNKYNMKASKKFGQNFIIDTNIIKRIAESANIDSRTCVIEIGPGIGALTEYLSYYACKVICYEIDERLKEVLNESLDECPNVEIIFEDFLKVDIEQKIKELRKNYEKIAVVTNLPYYITSDIIEKIVTLNQKVDSMTAMVQKEVALKLMNVKSPLSLIIQYCGQLKYCFNVSKNVFSPLPHVDSAIIHIDFKNKCDEKVYKVLKLSFQQKRKTIYNNLKNIEKITEILDECHIDERKRAEELSINDFIALSKYL